MRVREFRDSDTNPQIRRMLCAEGYDLQAWSDRQLAAIGHTARAVLSGERVFVSETMRPLVNTVVEKTRAAKNDG